MTDEANQARFARCRRLRSALSEVYGLVLKNASYMEMQVCIETARSGDAVTPSETKSVTCDDKWPGSIHAVCALPKGHTGDHRGDYQHAWTNLDAAAYARSASEISIHLGPACGCSGHPLNCFDHPNNCGCVVHRTKKGDQPMNERYYAEMESARNEAEEAYFKARPQLQRTHTEESLFEAGFERAFRLLWKDPSSVTAEESPS